MTERYILLSRDSQRYEYAYVIIDAQTGDYVLETNSFPNAERRHYELNWGDEAQ